MPERMPADRLVIWVLAFAGILTWALVALLALLREPVPEGLLVIASAIVGAMVAYLGRARMGGNDKGQGG